MYGDSYGWLAKLEAGQEVIYCRGYMDAADRELVKVARRTATQIIIGTGNQEERFRVKDGRRVRDSGYYRTHLEEAKPDKIEQVREATKRRRLINIMNVCDRRTKLEALPTEVLTAAALALTQSEQPNKPTETTT